MAVTFVLTPGVFIGELVRQHREGLPILGAVLIAVVAGLGAGFTAASHLYAAEKVRARFIMPIVAVLSASIGVFYLFYGIGFLR